MSKQIILILGAGSNVGLSVAKKFAADGYEVALAARNMTDGTSPEGFKTFQADLSERASVSGVFAKLEASLGVPNVVVYNAASMTPPPPGESAFSIPIETVERDMWINSLSAIAAAQEAIKGFNKASDGHPKRFIYTGNILNKVVLPMDMFVTLGMGKAASSYWISAADQLYAKDGYRFFYADQRTPDGGAMQNGVDGDAHADFYTQLVNGDDTIPSNATFVKGQGYKSF